jgi:hypothetical protein
MSICRDRDRSRCVSQTKRGPRTLCLCSPRSASTGPAAHGYARSTSMPLPCAIRFPSVQNNSLRESSRSLKFLDRTECTPDTLYQRHCQIGKAKQDCPSPIPCEIGGLISHGSAAGHEGSTRSYRCALRSPGVTPTTWRTLPNPPLWRASTSRLSLICGEQ